jgi:RNA-directed DNA polymerase
VRPLIEAFLNERGLRLSPEKTKVTHIAEGVDFLGQNIRSYNGAVLVTSSKKNRLSFLAKIRGLINANKGASQENLIRVLNPVLRDWVNYHRHISAKRILKKADHAIWHALWCWAKRRHCNKPMRWVARKYWLLGEGCGWRFAADTGWQTPPVAARTSRRDTHPTPSPNQRRYQSL